MALCSFKFTDYDSFSSTNHSMQSSAQPLKVPATPSRAAENDKDKTPIPVAKQPATSTARAITPNDISSPHELTAFVSFTTLISRSIFLIDRLRHFWNNWMPSSMRCRHRSWTEVCLHLAPFILKRLWCAHVEPAVTQMSTRVDALEASIQDIINGDVATSVPQSPSPSTPGIIRRSDSGLHWHAYNEDYDCRHASALSMCGCLY